MTAKMNSTTDCCIHCEASLACITGTLMEGSYGRCTECDKVVMTVNIEYSDDYIDNYDMTNPSDGTSEIIVPRWCPKATITMEVVCDNCEDCER